MIQKAKLIQQKSNLDYLLNENEELIAIFVKSILTAKQKEKKPW
jgi:hypothetical protein